MISVFQFRNILIGLILCGCIISAGTAHAGSPSILILHSYHQEYPWSKNENTGFIQTLTEELSSGEINFSTEYLDTKRVNYDSGYKEFFFQYLKHKYALYTPDIIFSSDDNALDFLLQFKEELFGDVPVVFCGVNNLAVESELNRHQYTGVFEKKEIRPNLALLQKINPQLSDIIFLGDGSSTDHAIKEQIIDDISSFTPKLNYTFLSNNRLSYHINHLRSRKEGVIFFTTIGGITDEDSAVMPLKKIITSIIGTGNFTVISMEDAYLMDGVLGGFVTSGVAQGKEAARLTIQVLHGKSPASVPLVTKSPNEFIFNYPQLERLGVSLSQLPETSVVLNRPYSFYDQNKYKIWLAMLFLIVQTFIIVALIRNIAIRKKAEKSLQKARDELELRVEQRTSELKKFKFISDHSNDAHFIVGKDGRFQYVNETACRMLGYTEKELLELAIPDVDSVFDFDKFEDMFNTIQDRTVPSFETVNKRKDGSEYPSEIIVTGYRVNGKPFIFATSRDITERKQAEALLKESERKFRAVFNNTFGFIGLLTPDGDLLEANKTALDLGGLKEDDVIGKKFWETPWWAHSKELCEWLPKAISRAAAGEIVRDEVNNIGPDGSLHYIDFSIKPIRDDNGNIIYLVSEGRDVTERKKTEKELQKIQMIESIGILAGGIAHDFNNLLAGIAGNVHIPKKYLESDSKAYNCLLSAEKAIQRAERLTRQLLTFSRGGDPVKGVRSITKIIRESAEFVMSGSNIICEYSVSDDLWLVEVDEGQISQALQNLILNASQAMPGGGTIRISLDNIRLTPDTELPLKNGKYVKVIIQDEGHGIPDELLHKIFGPYFTTKDMGRGLGLAITYSIITNHKGHIAVKSEQGTGTTFTLYLPASESQSEEVEIPAAILTSGQGKILLMDDEEVIWEAVGGLLKEVGYDVEYAANGEEAITLYKKAMNASSPFDVVILDLTVRGGLGGKETIKQLLKIDPLVKAIVSSGYSDDPVMANYKEYGFAGLIPKPCSNPQDMNRVLHRVIKG